LLKAYQFAKNPLQQDQVLVVSTNYQNKPGGPTRQAGWVKLMSLLKLTMFCCSY